MLPASTKQKGACTAFPDVCKTPTPAGTVPVPYPNFGNVMQAVGVAITVKFAHKPVCTKKSKMLRSQMDEPGTAGGVKSGVNMGPVAYKKCSMKVLVEGQQTAHHLSVTGQNGTTANAIGNQVAPSQAKVMVMP